jgi:hypothetical protein
MRSTNSRNASICLTSHLPRLGLLGSPGRPRGGTLLGVLGTVLATHAASAANKHWNSADGDWSDSGAWTAVGVPGVADAVFIGTTVPAVNSWIDLDIHASIASLTVIDGMMLDSDGARLLVAGDTLISGKNSDGDFIYPSRIRVDQSPFALDFTTDDLTLSNEGWLEIENGATMRANGLLSIGDDSLLTGEGTIQLLGDGAVAMRVNGSIGTQGDGLTIVQLGAGRVDLDGDFANDGIINLTGYMVDGSSFDALTIDGDALADDFNDDIWLTGQCSLAMDLDEGWTMGASSMLRVFRNSTFPGPAIVSGSTFTMRGELHMLSSQKELRFDAPVVLEESMVTGIGPSGQLEFAAAATIHGGTHVLDEDAEMRFDGSTTVAGGTFVTFSDNDLEGTVEFNGSTSWNGAVTIEGNARQVGNASVVGPTTIDATRIDLDGDGATAWSIGNALTINASAVDVGLSNLFDGSMTISGTFLGKLTMNLEPPSTHWSMRGTMDLGGVGAILMTRLAGDEMRMSGDLNVSGRVQSTADVRFQSGGVLTVEPASSALRLAGKSSVESGAVMLGSGALEVANSGDLTLANPTSLGELGLLNDGALRLGLNAPAGKATVDRFEQRASGTWFVDIGGHAPGIEHDFITVSDGDALLDGTLLVAVVDSGSGLFEPQLGDAFEILAAPGTVSGAFDNQPVSFVPGTVYLWDVNVSASSVELSLGAIVPCPADLSGDGIVDGADLGLLLAAWGACAGCVADINQDGAVDGSDLGLLLASWGACQY